MGAYLVIAAAVRVKHLLCALLTEKTCGTSNHLFTPKTAITINTRKRKKHSGELSNILSQGKLTRLKVGVRAKAG